MKPNHQLTNRSRHLNNHQLSTHRSTHVTIKQTRDQSTGAIPKLSNEVLQTLLPGQMIFKRDIDFIGFVIITCHLYRCGSTASIGKVMAAGKTTPTDCILPNLSMVRNEFCISVEILVNRLETLYLSRLK
jgi:hypothetical protein